MTRQESNRPWRLTARSPRVVYDQYGWKKKRFWRRLRDREYRAIARYLVVPGVDVGCGSRPVHPRFVLLDRLPRGQTIQPHGCVSRAQVAAEAERLPFKAAVFNTVVFFHALGHCRPGTALSEALRVCRPSGYVCVIWPDADYTQGIDSSHQVELNAVELASWLQTHIRPGVELVQFNTLRNKWSIDIVLKVWAPGPSKSPPTKE